jgi:hypothetical protein
MQERYIFKHPQPKGPKSLRIYETHVGMSNPVFSFSFYSLTMLIIGSLSYVSVLMTFLALLSVLELPSFTKHV